MTDALDRALRRANRAELDEQIGPGAFATYVDALDELNHSATQNILEWWRNQPPEVVDAMLDALRDRDAPHTVKKTEAETGRTGLTLLEELIALGLAESGLTGYEDEITQRLAPPPTHAEPHTSDALDHALRQANPAKLDRQIGPQAFTAYTNAVAICGRPTVHAHRVVARAACRPPHGTREPPQDARPDNPAQGSDLAPAHQPRASGPAPDAPHSTPARKPVASAIMPPFSAWTRNAKPRATAPPTLCTLP